jgi:hypothetical protein
MHLSILVEPVPHNGFRARSGEPLALSAEAPTADEAVRKLHELVSARLGAGARLLSLDLSEDRNPWLAGAGMFQDDPWFDEWQEEIARRRRELDADPDVP